MAGAPPWSCASRSDTWRAATDHGKSRRTRTGVSVVAVIRGEQGFPAPGPDFVLEPKDTLVVVGTAEGINGATEILASG